MLSTIKLLYLYILVYPETGIYFQNKPVFITVHAIKRARQREIAFPDQVFRVLNTGKVKRFGKRGIKFVGRTIICVGDDLGSNVIIKTVEKK